MDTQFAQRLQSELEAIKTAGLFKTERIINSPQGSTITVGKQTLLNFCSNNYLGLSAHPTVMDAAHKAINTYGFGMSSVRFICGTQNIHKELEEKLSTFLGMEDTILYAAAFDANGGVFEPLFNEEDAIISDTLNHASIIDGARLCKAKKFRYEHSNMVDLENKLKEAVQYRQRVIVTDGSFSMDGTIAPLDVICNLADTYNAIVIVDECHSTGFIGTTGRGTHEYRNVMSRIDIITGTLGKALGGASGGFTSAKREVIELLRQRSRPYLFSNTLAPSIVGASIAVLDLITASAELRDKLISNTKYFRSKMTLAGFDIKPGEHPIVPIMLYDAVLAQTFANKLLAEGIYVIGFFFPVVPKGQARIRVQLSAAHDETQLNMAIEAFIKVGKALGVLRS
jgi:glycine C-acetyltransferase